MFHRTPATVKEDDVVEDVKEDMVELKAEMQRKRKLYDDREVVAGLI